LPTCPRLEALSEPDVDAKESGHGLHPTAGPRGARAGLVLRLDRRLLDRI